MKRSMVLCAAAVVLAGSAWAQNRPQPQQPTPPVQQGAPLDWTKVGPMARKPTQEKQTKKEIEELYKRMEEAMKRGDMEAMFATVDFPAYMLTDDLQGVPEAREYSREQYVAMMKPFYENMPKDVKASHKRTIHVLSDSLANVIDDYVVVMGKQRITGRNASMLVKRDGQWKWKVMSEAGWGGMQPAQGVGGAGQQPPEGGR